MTQKQAHRRYMRIFAPSMAIYILGVFAVAYLRKNTGTPLPVLAGLTLIPAASVITWLWGHWRYINDLDEFLQKLQYQAIMAGLGILMSAVTVWGLLESLLDNPDFPVIPIFWVVPGFFVIYSLCFLVIGKRNGVKGVYL